MRTRESLAGVGNGLDASGRKGANGFAQVLITPPEMAAADGAAYGEPAIEVELAGKVRVRIPASVPAELAAAVVRALARR